MQKVAQSDLQKSMTYMDYLQMTEDLLAEGKTTGPYQTPFMIQYTQMNMDTMNRLTKDFVLADETLSALAKIEKPQKWLVITEPWCGDAGQVVPIIYKMVVANDNLSMHLVLRDENKALIQQFLTDGTESIPKLVCLDPQTLEVLGTWGPRPAAVQVIVDATKKEIAAITEKPARKARFVQAQMEVQGWYNEDKAVAIQKELIAAIGL